MYAYNFSLAMNIVSVSGGTQGSFIFLFLSQRQDLHRECLREALRSKKEEMRRGQEKLNSSLTTALCKSEEAILQDKKWMSEVKVSPYAYGFYKELDRIYGLNCAGPQQLLR